jgi:bacterioferritin (cytochrome b1)
VEQSWLQNRITATQTLIENTEDLLSTLLLEDTPTNRQYTLNTGQSVVTVMKRDLDRVQKFLDSLYNRLATLEARRNGASYQATPGY